MGRGWRSALAASLAALTLSASGRAAAAPHDVGLGDLMALWDLKGLYVSPDGQWAATLANRPDVAADSYAVRWRVVSLAGAGEALDGGDAGEPEFLDSRYRLDGTRGRNMALRAAWSPDGSGFAYLRQVAGEVQVWRTALASRAQSQLTHNAADVEDFVWSEDGRRPLFATAAPRAEIRAAAARQAREGFLVTPTVRWSYAAGQPVVDRYAAIGGKPAIWSLELGSGAEEAATEAEAAEYRRRIAARDTPVDVAETASGVSLVLSDPQKTIDEPPRRLVVESSRLASGCAPFGCEGRFVPVVQGARAARVWGVGRELFVLRREGENAPGMTLWRWPAGPGAARAVLRSDDDLTDCTRLAQDLVCLLQTPVSPRRVVRVSLTSGRILTLFDPNPQWRQVRLGKTRWIRWADAAGRPTYGVLIEPIGRKPGAPAPLVIVGYGTADAVRGDLAKRYPAQVLAAHGFAVLVYHMWEPEADLHRPDILARMYGGDAPDGVVSYGQLAVLVKQLAAEGLVDPARVGIGGHSEALNTIAWGLTHGNLFRAVSLGWIRWNPSDWYMPMDGFWATLERAGLLRAPGQPPGPIARDFSLSLNLAKVRAPVLVNASGLEMDHMMQWEALRRFADAGRPLEMHVAPGEDHVVFGPLHRWVEERRNVQWFEYWLQGREDPEPMDSGEYARWDRMKGELAILRGEPGR